MIPAGYDPDTVNATYAAYMARHGIPQPTARVVDVQPALDDTDETDCWTHAWEYAASHPSARYVEGVCRRRGRRGIAPHAWVLEDSPFGPQVRELTGTYENAYDYRGLVVDQGHPVIAGLAFDRGGPLSRPSMVQLVAAISGRSIHDAVKLLTL